jgi:hypothetical protein
MYIQFPLLFFVEIFPLGAFSPCAAGVRRRQVAEVAKVGKLIPARIRLGIYQLRIPSATEIIGP